MKLLRALALSFFMLPLLVQSQGEFKHLHYNLTLYGNPFGCDESTNNSNEKDAALTQIINYVQPDIFTVNEIRDQNVWAERILNNVLGQADGEWSRAALSFQSTSSSILNCLFYREDRFTLKSQEVVNQALDGSSLIRPIDIYDLYIDAPELASGDTTFVTFIIAHLSAGDEVERAEQTEALMARLEARGPGHYIFSGDLNIDSALEEAFQNLVSHSDNDLAFIDPISVPSTWHNNPFLAMYHTQSTRFSDTNGGCFAGGGLDDRFDITLISPSLDDGDPEIEYVSGSYEVIGQNGNDYNQELQTLNNGAVPDDIAMALYDMSDHLPVLTSYSTDVIISVKDLECEVTFKFSGQGRITMSLCSNGSYRLQVIDMRGSVVEEFDVLESNSSIAISNSVSGIFILRLIDKEGRSYSQKFFID